MPTVAIVGRPNVGKSAIFNRLAGRNIAIVHDQPGVTRDRISAPCTLTEHPCEVIDTGGIGATLDDGFAGQVTLEAEVAMDTANLILFVVDARDGLTAIDQALAQKLRRAKPEVCLILNKADHAEQENIASDFATLGLGNGIAISAAHGRGFGALCEFIDVSLKPFRDEIAQAEAEVTRAGLKIAIVGKPNAGKSSLINAILHDERAIVSEIAGTTRDALDIPYEFQGELHTLIDTAGLRQRAKMDTSVEVFSAMRTEKSIRRADLCLLVIDLEAGVSTMDRTIARTIKNENKPCLLVLNKWDLFHPGMERTQRLEKVKKLVDTELFFVSYAPIACVSAREGQHISQVFKQVTKIRESAQNTITTGMLNRLLQESFQSKPPGTHKKFNKRVKLLYGTAIVNDRYTAIPVPTYVLFVNDKRLMHEHYEQYLSNRIRDKHNILGVPIVFSIRSRNKTKGGKRGKPQDFPLPEESSE